MRRLLTLVIALSLVAGLGSCGPAQPSTTGIKVVATATFLADIAQNIAGDRFTVQALVPLGADPHEYEPTPADVTKVAGANIVIVNGAGYEGYLSQLLANAGGEHTIVEATAGLTSRPTPQGEIDPHMWLDPTRVATYVENIRQAFATADPAGAAQYEANAKAYLDQLSELDAWIKDQVQEVPPERRLLVTNHESLGYYADRYGFTVVGTLIASVSSEAQTSAQELAALVDTIRSTGAPAVFLEVGTNTQLADQVAQEAGVKVVTDLYTESTGPADSGAGTYLDMMRYNTNAIVGALK
jgi:ABC-type Zn uptake system ZnuABC Zn-binding protein ZnuA